MLKVIEKFFKKNSGGLTIGCLLFLGFLVRIYFADKYVNVSGDLLLYADWGEKFWEYGAKNFYFVKNWYYAPPNYLPIISLIYGASFWLYEHKFVLAQLHNLIKIPPSFFIIYFYDNGYWLLLKLPAILADLGLSLLIFKIIRRYNNDFKKSVLGMSLYLFNPVTIHLSSIWGQTDSLVAFFALISFLLLLNNKFALSMMLYFISLYIKPNWIYFLPLFLYSIIIRRPKLKVALFGMTLVLLILFITSLPFAADNVVNFNVWLFKERIIKTAILSQKASIDAFNFYAAFFELDYTPDYATLIGIPIKFMSYILYIFILFTSVRILSKTKSKVEGLMTALFILGFGVYLFFTNMLERYFFPAFAPLIILTIFNMRIFKYFILINLAVFANLIFAFFRRSYGVVADNFYANNYFLIRTFSLLNLFSWFFILKNLEAFSKPRH